ncbi:MAG: rRNA maturation RNase YbeY [Pseudomonadota bacterium]|nr:rRNA maturation RNase YbeY [Pseudomonadota bacterium]
MSVEVVVQYAVDPPTALPSKKTITIWVKAALAGRREEAQLTVRIVDEEEGSELNQRWRKRAGPTNVLSFPSTGLERIAPTLLGDIVICAPVVKREAQHQRKALRAHWAHMVIHGTLHLLGLDHIEEQQALIMEQLETEILGRLGYADPYSP